MAPRARAGTLRRLASGISVVFVRCTAMLPLQWARFVGRCLGHAAYWCVPRIRRVGLANLDLAYGAALSRREKQRIVRRSAENIGIVAAEFGHLPRLYADGVESFFQIEGAEHLDRSRGAVLLGAHLGNWEWMPAGFRALGFQMAVVYRPLDDPALDRFIADMRGTGGVQPVPKAEASSELVRYLREGWAVGILVDQSPRDNAVPITFFGTRTWATAAPVLLALRAKVPVYPTHLVRTVSGDYTLEVGPEIPLSRTGNTWRDLEVNTQRCHEVLEACIRQHTDQWLWFHRRWKPREGLEAAWAARVRRDSGERRDGGEFGV